MSDMARKTPEPRYVVCIRNDEYRASLVVRRLYRCLPDPDAEKRGLLRVVDESGEDYLFPLDLFVAIDLPAQTARRIANAT